MYWNDEGEYGSDCLLFLNKGNDSSVHTLICVEVTYKVRAIDIYLFIFLECKIFVVGDGKTRLKVSQPMQEYA